MSSETKPPIRLSDLVARDENGLACSKCGCRHLPVYYTRERRGYILRVRTCRHCGHRVTTREARI